MSDYKLNEKLSKAEDLLDEALSHSNGPPLGYKESCHYDVRRQVLDFIEVGYKNTFSRNF